MARRASLIDIVEVAYRAAVSSSSTWLSDVLAAARASLDLGHGVWAYEYDTNRPYAQWLSQPVALGGDPTIPRTVAAAFVDTPRALNEHIHKHAGVITILSELISVPAQDDTHLGLHARSAAIRDIFGVNAANPSGRGVYLCAAASRTLEREPAVVRRWEHVAAHVAAAARLRMTLVSEDGTASTKMAPAAILSPSGRVLDATRAAHRRLDALVRSVRAIERARSRRGRHDPASLASWRALTEGRWSLVDVVERDGKRFLFALPNPPSVLDPRRLTTMERIIARYVAMGHSNKLIAYELGVAEGTVAAHLHTTLKKLGLRRRIDIIARIALLSSGTEREVTVGAQRLVIVGAPATAGGRSLESLSAAELAIARLVARGLTNAEIAQRRRSSPRTVANQLARIFAKLGLRSRSELATHF